MINVPQIVSIVLLLLCIPRVTDACTAFATQSKDGIVLAKSYDWSDAGGFVLINKKGVSKKAFLLPGSLGKAMTWESRYGSITFNQYGRDFPLGGMNEKGLVIEVLWLNQTQYPSPQKKTLSINELQWIQYQLDRSSSIKELIENSKKMQVIKAYAPVHYFACDSSGKCATIEYINKKLTIHHGAKLPSPALTNNSYTRSLQYNKTKCGSLGILARMGFRSSGSLPRFCRASRSTKRKYGTKKKQISSAFRTLQNVKISNYSKWNIVYDIKNKEIYFRFPNKRKTLKIAMKDFKYSCDSTVKYFSLQGNFTKGQSKYWKEYKRSANLKRIAKSFAKLGNPFPKALIHILAKYPEAYTHCIKKK